jgi:hypothetical protein
VTTKQGAWNVGSSPQGADAEVGHPPPEDQRSDLAEVGGLEALGVGRRLPGKGDSYRLKDRDLGLRPTRPGDTA